MKITTKKIADDHDLLAARTLGESHHRNDLPRIPGTDLALMRMVRAAGDATGISLMRAWLAGWDVANLTEEV